MAILKTLNESQKQAVLCSEGPVLIIAGAGSGKTRVLTHRIAYLIKEKNISPQKILAFTFTNKAANELKHRIKKLIGISAKDMWVGTFHSICGRILRSDIDKLGWSKNFVIYDTDDQKSLIKQVLKEINLDFNPSAVLNAISDAKNKLISPQEYEQDAHEYFSKNVSKCYSSYQKMLRENNAMDFDDMIFLTIELFKKNPSVLQKYQKKFEYINIDEYQDTNHAQYVLANLLSQYHGNICVVGDDDQSIYGFRGADIRNILEFEKDFPDAKIFKLEENYRSTQIILDAANNVIANNIGRKRKKLWTKNQKGEKIISYQAFDEEDEANYIADEISKLSENFSLNDIAVLYRTNAQSRIIEEKLLERGIPYKIFSGVRFYERKEIKDLLSLLRIVANPSDKISLFRALSFMTDGIGKSTQNKIDDLAKSKNLPIFEALKEMKLLKLSPNQEKSILKFVTDIEELKEIAKNSSVSNVVERAIDLSKILKNYILQSTEESTSRAENIKEFLYVAQEFEKANEENDLNAFLNQISLMTDQDSVGQEKQFVNLMTFHSVKGLEFPVVFIVGFEEGIFPHYKSLMDSSQLEEERRLCYVAITRAKQKLYILHAEQRTLFGEYWANGPSRFLNEIPEEIVSKNKAEALFSKESSSKYFSAGDCIIHLKFGKGRIIDVEDCGDDAQLKVFFENGSTKILSAKYAPIKLENF